MCTSSLYSNGVPNGRNGTYGSNMVLPNFHSMSNSVVDIDGEEDGERRIYIPLRIPYEE